MKSNKVLQGFYLESNLSWRRLSELYTDVGGTVSASPPPPSSNKLFNGINRREYIGEIRELIDEIIHHGHFARGTGATWIIGKQSLFLLQN